MSRSSTRGIGMYTVSYANQEPLSEYDRLIQENYNALWLKALDIIGSTKLYLVEADTSENAACTLIADTYDEAKQKFAQFNPTCGTFVRWYGGFMRLVFFRMLRSCGHHYLKLVSDASGGCDPPTLHPSFQDLDDHLIRCETVEGILSHSDLDPLERSIVDLSYWRDWQGPEIAEQFHLSPDYLRAKRQRTLRKARSAAQDM